MRLALTVVSPGAQRTVDVVHEADPATSAAQVAAELGRFLSGDRTAPGPPSIGVAGQPIPPQLSLLESPITDGAVLSLGSPDGGVTA